MAGRAAGTAVGPMTIAAVERHFPAGQRLTDDALAAETLPAGARAVATLARWAPLRDWLIAAAEKNSPGIWAGIACRKRYLDERLRDALRTGAESVVVLGAGLDTRAARIAVPAGVPAFEVDLPVNIRAKQERLRSSSVTQVPVDFDTDDLARALAEHGYRAGSRTVFLWEGVTQYLTEAGVRATFDALAMAGAGSRLLFTFVRQDFLDGTERYDAPKLYQRFVVKQPPLWRFGWAPEAVAAFLSGYGWREREQAGAAEYAERYLVPAGRALPVSEIERCVEAEKA